MKQEHNKCHAPVFFLRPVSAILISHAFMIPPTRPLITLPFSKHRSTHNTISVEVIKRITLLSLTYNTTITDIRAENMVENIVLVSMIPISIINRWLITQHTIQTKYFILSLSLQKRILFLHSLHILIFYFTIYLTISQFFIKLNFHYKFSFISSYSKFYYISWFFSINILSKFCHFCKIYIINFYYNIPCFYTRFF